MYGLSVRTYYEEKQITDKGSSMKSMHGVSIIQVKELGKKSIVIRGILTDTSRIGLSLRGLFLGAATVSQKRRYAQR